MGGDIANRFRQIEHKTIVKEVSEKVNESNIYQNIVSNLISSH